MERREYEGIGYRLNRFRCNKRMTRTDLSNVTGIPVDRIVIYERGLELPTEFEMLKLSTVLEVHWDRIIFPGGRPQYV
nr:MAG TPA: helix-turn-helix domain protein [Caudoviricetes sp.]